MASRLSILLVDDNPGDIELVRAAFAEQADADIHWARNGSEGIQRIASQPPQVLMLDLGLPDMSGWSVLERTSSKRDGMVVVVLNALLRAYDREQGQAHGIHAAMDKPIAFDGYVEIADRIRALARANHRKS